MADRPSRSATGSAPDAATDAARTAVITGAGSGIGRMVAERLLSHGYTVLGSAIDRDEAAVLAEQLAGDFTPFVVDVADADDVDRAAAAVEAALDGRPLGALLNAAGITVNGPLVDLPPERFGRLLAVNVVGTHAMTRALLPQLRRHARPRVITMSSASGTRTMPFAGAYSASKFAVEALSSAMRLELAPLGVAVVVIAPGLTRTPMAAAIQEQLGRPPSLPEHREPLRRFLRQTQATLERGVPVERVVDAIVGAVAAPDPPRRVALHQSVLRDVVLMRALPARARDAIVRRVLALDGGAGR